MRNTLRVALLGAGKMAAQHAAALRHLTDARLVAVVDPVVTASEISTRFGPDVRPFADVKAMLAEMNPDVVHIVTPPATHAALARQCLAAGANVYVEKPFAASVTEAEAVLAEADTRGLRVCAAHQVMFQEPGRAWRRHLPMIGEIVHAESFFSFRPVRKRAGGGGLSAPVDQLMDILPHPVYLLLDALQPAGGAPPEVTALDVSDDGEVRAVMRRGKLLATLVVSLQARPVESWLRVMGRNGMIEADFVLGNLVVHLGPGASAPSVVLKPFSRAWQIGWGSFKAVLKLLFRGHKSYPGLAELLGLFYDSVRRQAPPPISRQEILDTVRVCEIIDARLRAEATRAAELSDTAFRDRESRAAGGAVRGLALVTGGTGLLGQPTLQSLRASGWRVRAPVRREVMPAERVAGVEYVRADLGAGVDDALLSGVEIVLHLAAETAGSQADHDRNTIQATRNLVDAMARTGVRRLVNVGSVAVLKPSRFGRKLREDSPIDHGNLNRGPYVWAKAAAEQLAEARARDGAIDVRTLRLGPLVDFDAYAPPGRLGREVARLFVAMGLPSSRLAICSVETAVAALRHYAEHFAELPQIVNVIESPPLTRRELVRRLRHGRPDLKVIWLPFPLLRVLSWLMTAAQKLRHPARPALDLYAAFKSENYDDSVVKSLQLRSAGIESPADASDERRMPAR